MEENAILVCFMLCYTGIWIGKCTEILTHGRPKEFAKKRSSYDEDSDEEESTAGKMPPSDSEEE